MRPMGSPGYWRTGSVADDRSGFPQNVRPPLWRQRLELLRRMPRIGAFARWQPARNSAPRQSSESGRNINYSHIESFKFSTDPEFVPKVRDIVGLYLNPPDRAIVLSVDEKSQIQALDRTQPILPLRPGLPTRQTHDYERHGTTTLFAALNVLEGTVIAECQPRHRHQEFLSFLERIDAAVDARLDVHLVLDNYGTHKHPEVKKWLADRPRYHVHFTPTSSSWLNQIERWFADITRKRIRRGTFGSVRELIKAIKDYVRHYNRNPQPFQWVATANQIVRKVRKYKETLETGD